MVPAQRALSRLLRFIPCACRTIAPLLSPLSTQAKELFVRDTHYIVRPGEAPTSGESDAKPPRDEVSDGMPIVCQTLHSVFSSPYWNPLQHPSSHYLNSTKYVDLQPRLERTRALGVYALISYCTTTTTIGVHRGPVQRSRDGWPAVVRRDAPVH